MGYYENPLGNLWAVMRDSMLDLLEVPLRAPCNREEAPTRPRRAPDGGPEEAPGWPTKTRHAQGPRARLVDGPLWAPLEALLKPKVNRARKPERPLGGPRE